MGGGFETLLKDVENASQIELDEGLRIEPEAREDFALNDASGVRLDALEPTWRWMNQSIASSSTRQTMYS